MDEAALRTLLADVSSGRIGPDEAVAAIRRLPYEDLGFARIDRHRLLRQRFPESVYAPGKTAEQCAAIVTAMLDEPGGGPVVLSRADPRQVKACLAAAPEGTVTAGAQDAATVVWRPAPTRPGRVLVVTAGTADLPVADECAAVLCAFGFAPERVTDVGVAGIHRILDRVGDLQEADAVVVAAGMEGALASVVGGLTAAPVVAVPTSVGYGASLQGVTALLGMLASCASGITVVGIDNGFGAAHAVARCLPGGSG